MSSNKRRFTLVAPSPREVSPSPQWKYDPRNVYIIPMCLGSICRRSAHGPDRDLRQSCKRLYGRHHLGRACRGADDIQMASISAKLLPISTRNLDAGTLFPASRVSETVLADSYSIVLQPLIWISYGHSIRRFSLVRSYVVEGVIDFHGNPWCV
ncbi:unnamed protein product [Lasius platythorax]|uniref:Uncharacterized protein n=1 Tax=Lasius platythorax TaxID=488582 RepID=A0AAV2N7S9_9HYME